MFKIKGKCSILKIGFQRAKYTFWEFTKLTEESEKFEWNSWRKITKNSRKWVDHKIASKVNRRYDQEKLRFGEDYQPLEAVEGFNGVGVKNYQKKT